MAAEEIDWDTLRCRHGDSNPVAGLYHAPEGCICFPDPVQALCSQHAVKCMQNNAMYLIVARPAEPIR